MKLHGGVAVSEINGSNREATYRKRYLGEGEVDAPKRHK